MTALATVQERIVLPSKGRSGEGFVPPSASELFAMLRRRTLLIIALFLLLSAMVAGGFFVWWFLFPGYRGECLIECVSNIPERELTFEQQRLRQDEHERFVLTQAQYLMSPTILGEALKINAVKETDWYKSVMRRKLEPLLELDRDLSAAPVRGTNFLRVSIECRNPKDPAVIVNEVVTQWYHTVKKRTAEEFASEALDAGRKDEEQLDREIAEKREQLKAIAQRLPAGARSDPGQNITAQNVKQYGEQVAQGKLELSQLEQFRDIYNAPEGVAVTPEDRAIVEQDPQVAELARLLSLLQQQRAADEKTFGARHTERRQMDARIAAVEANLSQLRLERFRERKADIREASNTAYDNTRHALFLSQESSAKAQAELEDQDRLLFDYLELENQIKQDVEYKLELSKHNKGLARIKSQKTAINVNVAQPAIDPLERSSPSLFVLPLGLFFAFVLALGLGLTVELMDKSVRTSQDIVRHLDVAMLGAIPDTDDEEVAIGRVETAVRDHPNSMVAEAFRGIRANLQFSAPAERQRSIVVTSPRAEDGTTTVATNLAMVVAQGGRRVLLVDANFRRPALHRVLDAVKPKGLSNILIGDGDLASLAAKTDLPLLDVLGGGPTPPNPAELLGSPQWRAFLNDAVSRYDQVIIDTPPILLASDGVVLATTVDGVILVVRAKRDSRGVARRAIAMLSDVNTHIFGAVLNAAQVTRGGYFREQLRAYYDYQPEGGKAGPRLPLATES